MKRLLNKAKTLVKAIFAQLKDRTNIIIFLSVFLVLSSEVWVPFLLGIITGKAWWYGIAATCWGFWLAPFTPFLPLCVAITFGIRKGIDAIRKRKKKRKNIDKTLSD